MKSIEYLKKLDRAAEIYGATSHTEVNLAILRAYMDGITDMALHDPDIGGNDFHEIISTKSDYIKDFKDIVDVYKEVYDEK